MSFIDYDILSAASSKELREKLTEKIAEGWQPFESPNIVDPSKGGPNTYNQAIVRSGDLSELTPSVSSEDEEQEPDYYYVVTIAGQSNSMSYGEGIPMPKTFDRPHPRVKQLARRSNIKPGGFACKYNEIIPADHCLHDVQDMTKLKHPKAKDSEYGCVGQGLHIGKKLLPFIPANAGILLVPCGRGGSGFTVTGGEGQYYEESGAIESSLKWGLNTPLYKDIVSRTKAALSKNKKNVFLGVIWMQGEADLATGKHSQHNELFLKMVEGFRKELSQFDAQCVFGSAANVPWICGDTTHWWKTKYPEQYDIVYGGYKGKTSQAIYFVPFMKDENGNNVLTNSPTDDPDIPSIGYYGSGHRKDSKTWTSQSRESHFGSWQRRGVISDRLATALLEYSGKSSAFVYGVTGEVIKEEQPEHENPVVTPTTRTVISLTGTAGDVTAKQGWTVEGANIQSVENGKAIALTKTVSNKTWTISKATNIAQSLLENGGKLLCKFKLSGDLDPKKAKFGFGIYYKTSKPVADNISFEGTGSLFLANFFLQTIGGKVNLMMHKSGNNKNIQLGSYGDYDNNWHTLELQYEKGTGSVVPVLDGKSGDKFKLVKDNIASGDEALTLTDITNSQTHDLAIETLSISINQA
ncbi:TPA: DUF1737 domain-containing protein [Escherichia coli]|nr:DUF1737 domain-containing protein [Escherichia coli]